MVDQAPQPTALAGNGSTNALRFGSGEANSMRVHFAKRSENVKTGPIPVSISAAQTCPTSCPLAGGACYAKQYPLRGHWDAVSNGTRGVEWPEFTAQIAQLPEGQLWRHNQAGDLPGAGDSIDGPALAALVEANRGRRGFTYTHKPPTTLENSSAIAHANDNGFTVNPSADNLAEADEFAQLGIGPVVVLPSSQTTNTRTPAGRRVVVCPATVRDDVSCASCQLCSRADRPSIVGFPAHGNGRKRASAVAEG